MRGFMVTKVTNGEHCVFASIKEAREYLKVELIKIAQKYGADYRWSSREGYVGLTKVIEIQLVEIDD